MLKKEQAIDLLINHPLKFAHMLGFTKLGDMHEAWLKDMIRGKKDKTLMAHRRSYKTTCVSIALAEMIILLPSYKCMFMRKTDSDVKEVIRQVRNILLDQHTMYIVQCIYGIDLVLTIQSATEITTNLSNDVKGTSQLVGIGTGGSLTGKHFDRIFTDDIINVNDRISKAERERTKVVYQELQNIRNSGGRIYNTLTPWHREDASTLMPDADKYDCYTTGILTKEELIEIKDSMTASLFAANYELKHIADDDVIFDNPKVGADIELARGGYDHLDSAYYGEDYSAYTAINIHNGKWYVYGRCWRKHVDDILEQIVDLHNDMRCQKLHNELNADKGYVAKELRKRGVKVATYTETQNKYIKITSYLKFEWKDVIFVNGTDKEYIDMICDYNENAEHDDACLAGETLIATTKGNVMIKDIKRGDYVITPMGARKVIDCGITGYDMEVNDYNGVIATPNHKFYDKRSNEFTRADRLPYSFRYDKISLKELIIWKRKLLYSMGKNIGEARRANIISSTQQEIVREEMQSSCTGQCGNITMEKFRKGITFITLTAISTIMTFPIWSAYQLGNIYQCMRRKIWKMRNTERETDSNLKKQESLRMSGIDQNKEENGTESTQKGAFSKVVRMIKKRFVNIAEKSFSEQQFKNIVQFHANEKREQKESTSSVTTSEYANGAEKSMKQRNITKDSVVQNASKDSMRRTNVYNLTIDKAGCFYANGILVSNCDSLASLIRIYQKKKQRQAESINV